MALNTFKCNDLTPLHFKGLICSRCVIRVQLVEVSWPTGGSTSQCVRPALELWNERLRQIFAAPRPLNCSTVEPNWVEVHNGTLRIDDSVVNRHGSVDCHYTPIHRGRDDFEVSGHGCVWPNSTYSICCRFVVDFRCHSQNSDRPSVLLHFMADVGISKDSKDAFTISAQ